MTINLKNFLSDKSKLSKMGEFQDLKPLDGLEVSSISADLYKNGRDDLALFYFRDGANYATLSTRNSIVSETITWNEKSNKKMVKALLVNTKNANTFTGEQGYESIESIAKNLAKTLTLRESKSEEGINETIKIKDLIFASTGVIGEKFPEDEINSRIDDLVSKLRDDQNKLIWIKTASAIMTTDTRPKLAYEEFTFNNKIIRIAAVAKGSGMIAPNLGTMLSFIFTDADISSNLLKVLLKKAVTNTFNAITIDSDQSTNDMVSIFSTRKVPIGQSRGVNDPVIQKFETSLKNVCLNLAKQIVVDGEGAKKFLTIKVINAKSISSAKKIAFSVASSPLVKTAVAGEDPNWGRVIMAIGKSNAEINLKKLSIKFGDIHIVHNGKLSNQYNENETAQYMKNKNIEININVGSGNKSFTAYTMDLTKKYIEINTDYRT